MDRTTARDAFIRAYRDFIRARYDYAHLHAHYQLPDSFDPERVALFRDFFLDYFYPLPERRAVLDEAFAHLDDYIKQPGKLLALLMDSAGLIFKYGRHLPKILKAGLGALQSFRLASQFEEKLIDQVLALELQAPFTPDELQRLLASLDPTDVDAFIAHNEELFGIIHDRELVRKVIVIVDELIAKMQRRPQVYSAAELAALSFGRNLIKQGNALFDQLTAAEQQTLIAWVIQIERDFWTKLLQQ
ncbi:MAG: hypothetical protein D6772_00995 [Bacteroidetes bacterium]|nr:MAG: hypothetical protein D6772_00995 [Bacteroidota bacterium]